ncbi:hypothetical protein E3O19_02980 [Cryobacterium algoritolerans]|uniref:Uncharacterized protein n=1 Tax=Cryobacterium algoritolerans TaxID=1259184 RepID=A0A4R8WZD8_9MICO|nr:hypothetical protein [Cryobacterium algoritolerans]TFC19602.1 hypothetical protein E3O19_02980 [Cryobacterium algoritolerans]
MNDMDQRDKMNDDNELDPLARLRAADPAAGVELRPGFADDVVADSLAHTLDEPAAESASVFDLGAARARRRPRWIQFVAVAASLVIVGGAGFGIGASAGQATKLADGAVPAISLQGAGSGGSVTEGGTAHGSFAGAPSGAPSKMSAGGRSEIAYPVGSGHSSFSSSGLSTTAGKASAYSFNARIASNTERVTALATALQVQGTAKKVDGSWLVGAQDGTAPYLSASLDGMLSFYFTDPQLNPWQCGQEANSTQPCDPPTDLPNQDTAIAALRSLIASAGRDPGSFEYTSDTGEGSFTRSAQAWPVVDGRRIDSPWGLELTAAGVYSASGALADIVPLGDYAIVSETAAFERLSDPRFGTQMTGVPIALRSQKTLRTTESVPPTEPPTEPPATPAAGTLLSWPVTKVDIVSARLGLTTQWQPNGSALIVPAYEFRNADGGTWSVIAVADSKLDFATK